MKFKESFEVLQNALFLGNDEFEKALEHLERNLGSVAYNNSVFHFISTLYELELVGKREEEYCIGLFIASLNNFFHLHLKFFSSLEKEDDKRPHFSQDEIQNMLIPLGLMLMIIDKAKPKKNKDKEGLRLMRQLVGSAYHTLIAELIICSNSSVSSQRVHTPSPAGEEGVGIFQ